MSGRDRGERGARLWTRRGAIPLDPTVLARACADLRAAGARAREARALGHATDAVSAALARLADPADPLREALEARAAAVHGPLGTWRWGLSATLEALSPLALAAWPARDLGDPAALHGWIPVPGGGLRRAFAPELTAVVLAGTLGPPALVPLVGLVLLRAPAVVKIAAEDDGCAQAFADALAAVDPILGDLLAVADWPGGDSALEEVALGAAEVVHFQGGDAALGDLRARLPAATRLLAHPHRLSITYLAADPLDPDAPTLARDVLRDALAYEQLGCLSPRAVFVEGDLARAQAWAARLGEVAPAVVSEMPPGRIPDDVALTALQARGRLAFTGAVDLIAGVTVAVDPGPFQPSPGGRFLVLRPASSLADALARLGPLRHRLQGAAVAAPPEALPTLWDGLAQAGAAWICAPGQLQRPPAAWPADGRPLLADLVRWAERPAS